MAGYVTVAELAAWLEVGMYTDLGNDERGGAKTDEQIAATWQSSIDRASEDIDRALASRKVDPYVTPVPGTATASVAVLKSLNAARALEWRIAARKGEAPPANAEIDRYQRGDAYLPDAPMLAATQTTSTTRGFYVSNCTPFPTDQRRMF